jgi:hypothetical protein
LCTTSKTLALLLMAMTVIRRYNMQHEATVGGIGSIEYVLLRDRLGLGQCRSCHKHIDRSQNWNNCVVRFVGLVMVCE